MSHLLTSALVISALVLPTSRADDMSSFEWKDGDRVVLIGDTLIERDQSFGYLETVITAQNPDKSITFRNLGWSGDTVRGLSRSGFGPPAEGWTQLKDHVLALKPTVLIVGYGMADSFDGDAGLASFVSGYNALLDAFAAPKPRLILLSPIAHEDLGRPLPDPSKHNACLKSYRDSIEAVASKRRAHFVDLLTLGSAGDRSELGPLTDDGIHLNDLGSRLMAQEIARRLGITKGPGSQLLVVGEKGQAVVAKGVVFQRREQDQDSLQFDATLATLPFPPPLRSMKKPGSSALQCSLFIWHIDIPDEDMNVRIDEGDATIYAAGKAPVSGVEILSGPDSEQAEALRTAINAKNRLYFYRWRPQNETYLFGFRKHEQGDNAREIPLFDPLVEAKEKEIANLRKPVKHSYKLTRRS